MLLKARKVHSLPAKVRNEVPFFFEESIFNESLLCVRTPLLLCMRKDATSELATTRPGAFCIYIYIYGWCTPMTMTMTMTMNKFYCHALHKEYRISCRVIHHYWYNLRYSTSESHTWQNGLEAKAYVPQYLLYNVIWKGARKKKLCCRFCSLLYTSAL